MISRRLQLRMLVLLVPIWLQANPPPATPAPSTPVSPSTPAAPATPPPAVATPPPVAVPPPAEAPALVALRKSHQAALKARQDALLKKHVEALRAMEAARVAQRDYAGAAQAADALANLEKSVDTGSHSGPGFTLNSRVPHSVSFGATNKLGGFQMNKANSVVRWDGVSLPAGRYQVKMTYEVPIPPGGLPSNSSDSGIKSSAPEPAFGGIVTFGEVTSINGSAALKFKVERTTEAVEKNTVDLGFITTSTSRPTFAFKAVDAKSEGVLTLLALELFQAPIDSGPNPDAQAKELLILREDYRKQLQDKTAGANKFWLTKLQELFKSATDTSNTAALELIKPELTRVTQLMNPADPAVAGSAKRVLLPAVDPIVATFNSEIRYSTTKDCLQRLRPAGARVSFKLAAAQVQPGRYQVELNINSGYGMGGAYLLTCGTSKISGELQGESSLVRRKVSVPKTLVIKPDAKYLEFSVESLALSTGSLCELRSIELIPEP
jgi:hypothetical protein